MFGNNFLCEILLFLERFKVKWLGGDTIVNTKSMNGHLDKFKGIVSLMPKDKFKASINL